MDIKKISDKVIKNVGKVPVTEGPWINRDMSKVVTTGSQFNQESEPAAHEDVKASRLKFDGSDEPEADPKGGKYVSISPDGIVKRDGKKRFAF